MSATNQPYGLIPLRHMGGGAVRNESIGAAINSGYGSNISQNQAVILTTSGVLNPVTGNGDEIYGVFAGVQYNDSNGNPQNLPNWVANTVATSIDVYLFMDPMIVYKIQANGSIAVTGRGACGDLINFTSAANGFSQEVLNNAVSSIGQLRIIDKYLAPGNDWSDAFTEVQVTIAKSQIIAQKSGV